MLPNEPGAKNGPNRRNNKSKTTRAAVDQSPEAPESCRESKKSKHVGPSLKKHSQTGPAVVSKKDACPAKHAKSREVTSIMQAAPKQEAKSSNQDSRLCKQCPKMSAAVDDNSEEDLYRAAEEIEQERQEKQLSNAASVPKSEDQSSVSAPEALLSYGQREWKGNTAKSHLIRKGYEAVAQKFESLRRVRGDNYCALRATLFQLFNQSSKVSDWLQDAGIVQCSLQSVQDLVEEWTFPFGTRDGGAVEQLEHCLKLLRMRWQEAVRCESPAERERVCQQLFVGGREEYELLEALKFLMLKTVIQLHLDMKKGSNVPEFCWLLFARDTSKCPRSFLTNHLRYVGFSGGLEQVEMFLLGYALQHTLQAFRLYKTDTEEFITYYPDDHRTEWPCLSLVTEDDRHYNVPVPKQSKVQSTKHDKSIRPKWNLPSSGAGKTTPL